MINILLYIYNIILIMGVNKIIAKKVEIKFYKQYKLNIDVLNIIFSYINNIYLNKKEKKIYLIFKMNEKIKQRLNYFSYQNNEYINHSYLKNFNSSYIMINYLFERHDCDLKIKPNFKIIWDEDEYKYINKTEPNQYEININCVFNLRDFTDETIKEMRSVLYRLRYINKLNEVYYVTYSLKKNNYRDMLVLKLTFIITLNDALNIKLNNILNEKIDKKRIYDFKDINPSGENNNKVKKNIALIKEIIIDKINKTLDDNLIKLKN